MAAFSLRQPIFVTQNSLRWRNSVSWLKFDRTTAVSCLLSVRYPTLLPSVEPHKNDARRRFLSLTPAWDAIYFPCCDFALILRLNFATCACSPRVDCFSVSHFSAREPSNSLRVGGFLYFYFSRYRVCVCAPDGRTWNVNTARALLSDVSRARRADQSSLSRRGGCSLWIRAAGAGFNEGRSQTNPLIIRRTPSALSIRLPPAAQIKRAKLYGFEQRCQLFFCVAEEPLC